MDIEQLSLMKLVDSGSLQSFQDSFSAATGMAIAAIDKGGSPAGAHWCGETDFCRNCMKKSSDGADRCKKYAMKCIEEAAMSTRPVVNVCPAGVTEFAVPVIVKGVHMGTLLGGQVTVEKPVEGKLTKLARDLKIDPADFIAGIRKLEHVSNDRVESAAHLLMDMVTSLAEQGYEHLASAERGQQARDSFSGGQGADYAVKQKIDTTVDFVKKVEHGCGKIKDAVADSARAVENTDSIVKTIENASTQLTLIGFNASIEAKRAGAAGQGFNVIAQEVRTLADKNSKQAVEIEHTLNSIKKTMIGINTQIRGLYTDIEKIVDSINDLSCVIVETSAKSEEEDT